MNLKYEVSEKKKLRVIVDTDAACEADDPFAIAHALMSPKLEVKGILAEQFGNPATTEQSYQEIETLLEAMDISVPVFMGESGSLKDRTNTEISPAARFVIEEANRTSEKPLYILCLGAITNIATAIQKCPDIVGKMTVVWIGGQNPKDFHENHREFNAGNDIEAINIVIGSGVEFWQIPNNVYGSMRIGIAEIQKRIYPCGKVGKHLFENMVQYNMSEHADWTPGESWSLGDSPAIGVALDPAIGGYEYREAPIFNEDTTYRFESGRPNIRVYTSIDSRYILEDLIAKLQLLYGDLNMKEQESIQKTKIGFEQSFKEGSLYNKQTQDDDHIERILQTLPICDGDTILDLGTGSGYLAFAMAKRFPKCQVIGLDIVETALEQNRENAKKQGIENVTFVSYDGMRFPFDNSQFACITTRYALHHFPAIADSFQEVARVLQSRGTFFVADPTPNEEDTERFVDAYMQMKKDGHIKYYTKEEFTTYAREAGLKLEASFHTEITFPRLKETAYGFDEIMQKHKKEVIEGYQVRLTEKQKYITITQKVLNLLFKKDSK